MTSANDVSLQGESQNHECPVLASVLGLTKGELAEEAVWRCKSLSLPLP